MAPEVHPRLRAAVRRSPIGGDGGRRGRSVARGLVTAGDGDARHARSQVETGRSITDPQEYLAYVKSLASYQDGRDYGDKV